MCMVKKNNSITSNQVKNTLWSSACYRQTLQSMPARTRSLVFADDEAADRN